MKSQLILKGVGVVMAFILLYSCYNEQSEPVQASFEYQYTKANQTIPALLTFINKSTGGDHYSWEFEGGHPQTSSAKDPGQVSYVKPGKYTVTLTVTNVDGEENTTSQVIELFDTVKGDFTYTVAGSKYPPVVVTITNDIEGEGLNYLWQLEGSQIKEFKGKTPPALQYEVPGTYDLIVLVSNGQDTVRKVKTLEVAPDIAVDFTWEVAHRDYDYQAPVQVHFKNKTIAADTFQWEFEGSATPTSTAVEPTVVFNRVGKQKIKLTASNDKKSKSIVKEIAIYEDTNLYVLTDIKLGNMFSHNTSEIPALYSTSQRQAYFTSEVDAQIAPAIDVVFTGMTSNLSRSKFSSPSSIHTSGLLPFEGGQHVKIINSQELCNCGVNFTITDFLALENDRPLQRIEIVETAGGQQFFTNQQQRIVLFETSDGRKGAIYVKEFVQVNTQHAYVLCDIKVQKVRR
ncbi:PKD domain-containing protein [Myroides sp. WP-1]|uniref:PKD domain-containing protein n=1 Tax=Myroides sp. WP-1 TaxID=2759944 RepID=UPI0015F7ADFB|nr:PKD domain-containing protein [Myroides sp. WP-1]MBB1140654.1 PKD domain-containing protein [Myroides sp. WP-1]